MVYALNSGVAQYCFTLYVIYGCCENSFTVRDGGFSVSLR